MKVSQILAATLVLGLACSGIASAQSWTPLTNQPVTVGGFDGVGSMLQLRDGREHLQGRGRDFGTSAIAGDHGDL